MLSGRQPDKVVHSPANVRLRGCKLGESADLFTLESKTAALTKILP